MPSWLLRPLKISILLSLIAASGSSRCRTDDVTIPCTQADANRLCAERCGDKEVSLCNITDKNTCMVATICGDASAIPGFTDPPQFETPY